MIPAQTFPPPMPQPQPPGWWARNWKWCVPVAAVSLLGLFVAFVFMIVSLVFGLMKSSEPYKEAMVKAMAHPQVRAELGVPVADGFFVSGNISTAGTSGQASLDIPISGPKGKGDIYVEAKKSGGTWTYTTLEVAIEGKPDRIELKP